MSIFGFFKSKKEIKEKYIPQGPSGCMASNRITVDGCKVGYMYREEPDADATFPDSGWRFFAGDEDESYTDNPDLDAPYGVAFVREGDGFVRDE